MKERLECQKIKLKSFEEARDNFKKLQTWIKPFIQENKEVNESLQKINSYFSTFMMYELLEQSFNLVENKIISDMSNFFKQPSDSLCIICNSKLDEMMEFREQVKKKKQ